MMQVTEEVKLKHTSCIALPQNGEISVFPWKGVAEITVKIEILLKSNLNVTVEFLKFLCFKLLIEANDLTLQMI